MTPLPRVIFRGPCIGNRCCGNIDANYLFSRFSLCVPGLLRLICFISSLSLCFFFAYLQEAKKHPIPIHSPKLGPSPFPLCKQSTTSICPISHLHFLPFLSNHQTLNPKPDSSPPSIHPKIFDPSHPTAGAPTMAPNISTPHLTSPSQPAQHPACVLPRLSLLSILYIVSTSHTLSLHSPPYFFTTSSISANAYLHDHMSTPSRVLLGTQLVQYRSDRMDV